MSLKSFSGLIKPRILSGYYKRMKVYIGDECKYGDRNVSALTLLWLWKNGFHSWHKELFKLNKYTVHYYLSEWDHYNLHPINGLYSKLIDNKAFLPLILDFVPAIYIVFEKGLERYRKGIKNNDMYSELRDFLSSGGEIIVKPLNLEGGVGFGVIENANFKNIIGRKIRTKQSFAIQNKVEQHEYANNIYSGSANTIRIVLYRDVNDRRVRMAGASHRFGTDNSKPVDNLGKWGMLTAIDTETGKLGISYIYRGNNHTGWHEYHPNTGAPIMNTFIPEWKEKISKILEVFNQISWFEYGGLDVVFTKDGFIVLEINSMPHIDMIQAFEPYLLDKSLRDFFVSKGLKLKKARL